VQKIGGSTATSAIIERATSAIIERDDYATIQPVHIDDAWRRVISHEANDPANIALKSIRWRTLAAERHCALLLRYPIIVAFLSLEEGTTL
jgi:hypothetical protein